MALNKELKGWFGSAFISFIMGNLGVLVLDEQLYIGIITILTSFVFLYITYYSLQIGTNQNDIDKIKKWIENKEEILNTLTEIVMLKKVSKIK